MGMDKTSEKSSLHFFIIDIILGILSHIYVFYWSPGAPFTNMVFL